jgi:hypothetical protein
MGFNRKETSTKPLPLRGKGKKMAISVTSQIKSKN